MFLISHAAWSVLFELFKPSFLHGSKLATQLEIFCPGLRAKYADSRALLETPNSTFRIFGRSHFSNWSRASGFEVVHYAEQYPLCQDCGRTRRVRVTSEPNPEGESRHQRPLERLGVADGVLGLKETAQRSGYGQNSTLETAISIENIGL